MKRIIVIGAGYGGLRAIEKLIKQKDVEIILIDKNSYHYLQTEAYGYIAGQFDICDITVDIQAFVDGLLSNVKFINEEVVFIDSNENKIKTTTQEFIYDDLIIATGAKTNFPAFIHGLKENSHGIKVLSRAFEFKSEFENIIYKKVINHEQKIFNIIIGGAGLSGVEIAAEMAYIAQKFTKSIGIKESNINIYLIEAYDTILNGMSPFIIQNTMKRLEKLGVKVMLNSFINSVEKTKVILKNETIIDYDFMIFTGGIKANQIDADKVFETNRIGQYLLDDRLHIKGYSNIYAVGDCAELKDTYNNLLPPTAQSAEQSAEYVVKHIRAKYQNIQLEPYHGKIDGIFVALGGEYAVGEVYKFLKFKGYSAYLFKKIITKLYHYGLKLKFNNSFILRG